MTSYYTPSLQTRLARACAWARLVATPKRLTVVAAELGVSEREAGRYRMCARYMGWPVVDSRTRGELQRIRGWDVEQMARATVCVDGREVDIDGDVVFYADTGETVDETGAMAAVVACAAITSGVACGE